jgi:hypothetical protein
MKIKVFLFIFVLFAGLSALNAQSLADAQKAADDATRRLEEAFGGGSAAVQTARGGSRPRWVNNPYSEYPKDRYIAATGSAETRADAEAKAFAALVSFFGQSVRSDLSVASVYSEAVTNGIMSVSENTNVRELIVTAALLDNLVRSGNRRRLGRRAQGIRPRLY